MKHYIPNIKDAFLSTLDWIKDDFKSWPLRFGLEVIAWGLSIGAAVLFNLTVPDVPFILYLLMTTAGSAIYTWAAWTRGSFGMLANYLLLTHLDIIGLIRLLM